MSGGGNKKKQAKAQGWEEAGSEFYQESYPADGDISELWPVRDPKYLTTLLPSKQNRTANTIRNRTNDNKTLRNKLTTTRSRRESTVYRRNSNGGDAECIIPDLSEMQSTEQTTWEEIRKIKDLPLPMAEKRIRKANIMNQPELILHGYEQFKWKRRKMWRHLVDNFKVEPWKGALKVIEGYFGTGVVSYFLFLKYLLYLNLFICTAIFIFIVLPTVLSPEYKGGCKNPDAVSVGDSILDLVQGTGFMECSLLFYGFYSHDIFAWSATNAHTFYYNLPLAYISIVLVCFGVSLVTIVKSAANNFKERVTEGEGQFYKYCNLVFSSWDFCIHNEKSAVQKHKAIYNEIKSCLAIERLEEIHRNRTRNQKIKLFIVRLLINVIVLAVWAGGGCAIFYTFQVAEEHRSEQESVEKFVYGFLPSIVIVTLNILVPIVFKYLVMFEKFSPDTVLRVTLWRTVFLRLASIITLCASLYIEIEGVECWETHVGQQIYKLVLTDFATHVVLTFVVNFPRALLAKHFQGRFFQIIGEQSFDLSKHVLDVIYSQTLCWLGCFYAPLLSLVFSMVFLLLFYIKKFVCLVNSTPSLVIYRASRSHSMFMAVLLVSFVAAAVPLAYSIAELEPSKQCGPFQGQASAWETVERLFGTAPTWLQQTVRFLTTAGFAVPVFIVLVLLLYYFKAVTAANRQMVAVLKNQLILEGHDKQFLLDRLSRVMKQQQDNQRRLAHLDVLRDGVN